MYKKLILLLVTGVLMTQVIGCGNKNSQESTDKESAVVFPTADSDNNQLDLNELPQLPGTEIEEDEAADDEPVISEPADLACVLPRGFKAYADDEGIYVHRNYPKDSSVISYVIAEDNSDLVDITGDDYKKLLEDDFLDSYGDEVEVMIHSFEEIRIDSRKGYKIKLEYEFKGYMYEQLVYVLLNGDESHVMTYTQEEEAGWMDDFEESGDTLHFVKR